jgi:hypothetical protein
LPPDQHSGPEQDIITKKTEEGFMSRRIAVFKGRISRTDKNCGGSTRAMSSSWFVQHRQEWIAETIRIFGFINREHLELKFGISTPQASLDLQFFQEANPGVITYNKSTKRYEARP